MILENMEYSILIVKPDLYREGAMPYIRQKVAMNLEIIGEHPQLITRKQAGEMYKETKGLFHEIVCYMSSGPSYIFVVRGLDAIRVLDRLKGRTSLGQTLFNSIICPKILTISVIIIGNH